MKTEEKFHKEAARKEAARDYKGALQEYDKAIDVGNNSLSHVYKAGIYHKMGNDKAVLECLNKALSINENCPQAYVNRALYHRHNKNYEAAQRDFEKAMELEPVSFEIVLFNEEDIFKYSELSEISTPEESIYYPEGELFFNLHLTRKNLKKVKHVDWKEISKLHVKIDLYKKQGKPTEKLEKQLEALNKQEDEYEVYDLELHNFDTNLTVGVKEMTYFFIYRLYPKAIYNQKLMQFQYRLAKRIFNFKTYVLGMKVRPLLISNTDDVDDDTIISRLSNMPE